MTYMPQKPRTTKPQRACHSQPHRGLAEVCHINFCTFFTSSHLKKAQEPGTLKMRSCSTSESSQKPNKTLHFSFFLLLLLLIYFHLLQTYIKWTTPIIYSSSSPTNLKLFLDLLKKPKKNKKSSPKGLLEGLKITLSKPRSSFPFLAHFATPNDLQTGACAINWFFAEAKSLKAFVARAVRTGKRIGGLPATPAKPMEKPCFWHPKHPKTMKNQGFHLQKNCFLGTKQPRFLMVLGALGTESFRGENTWPWRFLRLFLLFFPPSFSPNDEQGFVSFVVSGNFEQVGGYKSLVLGGLKLFPKH